MGVNETDGDGIVRHARFPLGGDRLFADRFAGHVEPLFPFREGLRLSVGEQQQPTADRTAALLRLQQVHGDAVKRWRVSLSSLGPVFGQGRIVR